MVTNGIFRYGLQFFVNSLDEEFAISLTGINMKSRAISEFAMTATSLMRKQGLDNRFGRAWRRVRRLETAIQTPTKRQRIKEEVALEVPVLRM